MQNLFNHLTFFLTSLSIAITLLLSSCGTSHTITGSSGYTSGSSSPSQTQSTQQEATPMTLEGLVAEAHNWIGTPYLYGGNTRSGVDCSGLVVQVYKKIFNIALPRTSKSQQSYCRNIKRKDLKVGDLVFFATRRGDLKTVSHVGIYIGDNKMIHASSSRGVIISNLDENYYTKRYLSSGRIEQLASILQNHKPETTIQNSPQPQPNDNPTYLGDELEVEIITTSQPISETNENTPTSSENDDSFPDFMD